MVLQNPCQMASSLWQTRYKFFIGKVTRMTKRLFFILGVIAGLLIGEIFRRKHTERLKVLEEKEAHRKWMNAEAEKRWLKSLDEMPFEKRMDYELFEASLKASNYQPDWDEEDDDED
jgi:hypothetical protein